MKPSDPRHHDWMDARLEAYLDEALPADEHARFERGLALDADWDAELFLARQIRDGLQTLPEPVCPPQVAEAVMAQVRREAQRNRHAWIDRLQVWLNQQVAALWQPALAMTVLLLLVISAALVGRPAPPPTNYAGLQIEQAEVEQALAEVKRALGYVSEASRQTGRIVRDDVIAERVVGRMQHALHTRPNRPEDTQR